MKDEPTRIGGALSAKSAAPAPIDPNHPFFGLAPSSIPVGLAEFRDRLVTLCDGRAGLRGALQVEIHLPSDSERRLSAHALSGRALSPKAAGPSTSPEGALGERAQPGNGASPADSSAPASLPAIIDFMASTEALDRYHEVIVPLGWRLEQYRRNPVFQNAHQYGDIIFTLGKALITEVRPLGPGGGAYLFQRVEFAVGANPMARIAHGLYRGKFLNAVSVGFIPLRWENGDEGAGYRRRYLEQELLEVSAVGIPANPEALQLGLKTGAIQKSDLQELAELCSRTLKAGAPHHDFCGNTAVPNTDTGALGVRNNGAQLLQLARALRSLLRRT
jgi:hypothetical protein